MKSFAVITLVLAMAMGSLGMGFDYAREGIHFQGGSSLGAAPPHPSLPQVFTTNYTLRAPLYVTSKSATLFRGFFAFDYKLGGAQLRIGGEEEVPIYFHTNFIASPTFQQGSVTGFMYQGPLCWNAGHVPSDWLQIFPFQLPRDASFMGYATVNGRNCSAWQFDLLSKLDVEMYIDVTRDVIVQIINKQVPVAQYVVWNFEHTVPGPFSPTLYQDPAITYGIKCVKPPFEQEKRAAPAQSVMDYVLNTVQNTLRTVRA